MAPLLGGMTAAVAATPDEALPARGFLGVSLEPVSDAVRAALALEPGSGVLVRRVLEGGAAEEAGVEEGDVVVSVGGRPIRGPRDLMDAVASRSPADRLDVEVWRRGRLISLGAFLQARPEEGGRVPAEAPAPAAAGGSALGLTLLPLTDQLADYFTAPGGALVARVAAGSPAEVAGVLAGDVIVSVDDNEIRAPADVGTALRDPASGHALLGVVRNGADLFLQVAVD